MIYVIPFGCSLSVGQQVAYVKLLRVVPKTLEVVVFALILLEQVDEHAAEVEQNPAGRASLNVLGCCAELVHLVFEIVREALDMGV